jgi:GR25 family glycosyltransferase involved in LPS biosynthesis
MNVDKVYIVSIQRTATQQGRKNNIRRLISYMRNIFKNEPEIYGVDGENLTSSAIKTLVSEGKLKNKITSNSIGLFNYKTSNQLNKLVESTFTVNKKTRNMRPGEIGCSLSHIGIFEKIVKNKYPYALVLEDDAKLLCDPSIFKTEINKLLTEIPKNFYILSLFQHKDLTHNKAYNNYIQRSMVGEHLYRIHELTYGTVAYIISYEGAINMLQKLYPISYPIDYALSRECYFKTRGYVSKKPLIDVCLYEETSTRK